MNDLTESLRTLMAHQKGIVPLAWSGERHDINRDLSTLPPEEVRAMKRKFRKMWRAEARNAIPAKTKSGKRFAARYKEQLGLGAENPTKTHKRYRKAAVFRRLSIDTKHMLDKISGRDVKASP